MIRKIVCSMVMLGLCGGLAVYLSSCAKLAGPLSPETAVLAPNQVVSHILPTLDPSAFSTPSSVSQPARARFTVSMDP
ncbi:hypothetical protein JW933_08120, partial [candidate division FCPU426 bacterium]|nr:hypothetical protein [candidate division FCPU426 bacterium]